MWFKNLKVYRLAKGFQPTQEQLEELLFKERFVEGNLPFAGLENIGFAVFFEDEGTLVHKIENNLLFKLKIEKKLIPSSTVKQHLKEEIRRIKQEEDCTVGSKRKKEIKERVINKLHAQAFSVFQEVNVWLDLNNHWLIIDTNSSTKADSVISLLAKIFDPLPVMSFMTERSPTSCMSEWLMDNQAPHGFTIDESAEFKSMVDSRIKVRFANKAPVNEEIKLHIKDAKLCSNLSLTWDDRVSFVLDELGNIKRITPLEVLAKERKLDNSGDYIENYNAEMCLMFGEINGLLHDLINALGGEKGSKE